MKKFYLFIFLISIYSFSQKIEQPKNLILTQSEIFGNSDFKNIIKVDVNKDSIADYTIVVNYQNQFKQKFNPLLDINQEVLIWSEDYNGIKSTYQNLKVKSSEELIQDLMNGKIVNPKINESVDVKIAYENYQFDKLKLKNTKLKYKTTIINTNFSVPLIRFNFTRDTDGIDKKDGEIDFLNSIGAGFGISFGEIERTRDSNGEIIDEEFTNTFGIHLGALFSASTGEDNKNVFAPHLAFTILDFQVGFGVDLGDLGDNQQKTFITVGYGIPLYKLTKGKYWIWKQNKGAIYDTDSNIKRLGN